MTADWTGAIDRARAHAPFLATVLDRLPDLTEILASGDGEGALAHARAAGQGATDVGVALRRERQAMALALAVGDLAGAFPLLKVTGELSAFADRALDAAIAEGIRRRAPDSEPAGFLALALGKHGARELNYSSDIDPILLFDPELLPRRERDEPGEAAQRVARVVVETLSRVTDEGYVFRVDLRLRPASEVSPLAISIDAALTHYESSALAWERAAFIRARACAGDIAAGEAFLAAIRPFVWRKSLDFGAIAEIGRLTAQIRANTRGGPSVGLGFDLKKGRGGIREIEFYAQTHQLIHGGRNPALRLRGTRATLDALAEAGLVAAEEARMLGESYDRLRTVEHRLQMMQDQQTHSLPKTFEALDEVARLDGLPGGQALLDELTEITEAVGARYDALIMANTPSGDSVPVAMPDQASLLEDLEGLGFADPAALAERIEGWQSGRVRALRSDAARTAFEAIRRDLLAALAAAPEPERALSRWEQLLNNLPSAINLFRLLEARPGLLELLARILSLAPPLADALARRADLLDPLIDSSAFDLPGEVPELIAAFSRFEPDDDYERKLDSVRRKVGELRFMLGVQLIEGSNDPIAIGRALARVAEAALVVLTDATLEEFRATHGRVPDSEMLVLGLGRMGGGVLTHASDLDLVYLFDGDFHAESDGRRPLGATHYYNRLSQRTISALSVPTAEGALYEIDTRLRPSGAQGPAAASLDSFERYQREQAWTWEHMALCRARPLYGSPEARGVLSETIAKVLTAPRDLAKLQADVLEMRGTMAAHKPPKGPLDVKLSRGGLVDLEFIVHFVQLREGKGLDPDLAEAIRLLAKDGLLPAELAQAHDVLTRFLVAARLLAPDSKVPCAAACMALVRACGYGTWEGLEAGLAGARAHVAAAWRAAFGETLETNDE
ncbi:bifunctional [glutamine synthetase] adenylyltransferase/[glutamine synthetase]-adenylyl-L-tyrosine phosphorylase [Novosphingobium mangrovi (ex Huang et al. 2023)]|uniref:Bifunctional [glutamine synthetase] adenylyltransferase/[glutamine synthetase]-adenylyl-L-tyrosine phosphorylase n=1 Tax=Novosphingobium mangrovi (ex Huang et al. 2023) TaxID=2976432 RepID=A0ABT2I9S0_9SPHN|nr:bifunctional [glutamine synthetase] adenylyltransferase/[glutamine synthetase]-adenylyl-L-tyrosine phosphorylase [Novosphingobium mangrovi (ex Huang et al. 2023)]MCT2401582.1 bifunctional [glutamine synthetase] adenylyltransferase/[glutamine synthetase]-adenylyl-L-tyrosine phosphorylase [Novosphingobium mangrovi (ex Huang et al. 2023)]